MPTCYWLALDYPGDDKVVHFSSSRICSCCFLQPVFVVQVSDFCVLMVTRWLRIFQTRYFLSLVFHDYIMFLKISYSWVCFTARLFLQMVQNAERLPIAECHSKVAKFCKFIELRNGLYQIPVWVIVPSELNLALIHSVSCQISLTFSRAVNSAPSPPPQRHQKLRIDRNDRWRHITRQMTSFVPTVITHKQFLFSHIIAEITEAYQNLWGNVPCFQ